MADASIKCMFSRISALLRRELDYRGVGKQEALVALAAVNVWLMQRPPKHVQDDLDEFISPAVVTLMQRDTVKARLVRCILKKVGEEE